MSAPLTRPNGKTYRPRKPGLRAHPWENPDDDWMSGVLILGTLDPAEAQAFADRMCNYWFGYEHAISPLPGWWHDGFWASERRWIEDAERGLPGVMFTASSEPDTVSAATEGDNP